MRPSLTPVLFVLASGERTTVPRHDSPAWRAPWIRPEREALGPPLLGLASP
jgi:hypothetical protein